MNPSLRDTNPSLRDTNWEISGNIILFEKEWVGSIVKKEVDFTFLLHDCIGRDYPLERIERLINQIPRLEYLIKKLDKKGIKIINIPKIPSKKEYQRKMDVRFYEAHGYFPRVQKYTKVKWMKGNKGYGYYAKVKKEKRE